MTSFISCVARILGSDPVIGSMTLLNLELDIQIQILPRYYFPQGCPYTVFRPRRFYSLGRTFCARIEPSFSDHDT